VVQFFMRVSFNVAIGAETVAACKLLARGGARAIDAVEGENA
jgi:hypothetical protein